MALTSRAVISLRDWEDRNGDNWWIAAIPSDRFNYVIRTNERRRRHIDDRMVGQYLERPATIAGRSGGGRHFIYHADLKRLRADRFDRLTQRIGFAFQSLAIENGKLIDAVVIKALVPKRAILNTAYIVARRWLRLRATRCNHIDLIDTGCIVS